MSRKASNSLYRRRTVDDLSLNEGIFVRMTISYVVYMPRPTPWVIGLRTCGVLAGGAAAGGVSGAHLDLEKVLGRAVQLLEGLLARLGERLHGRGQADNAGGAVSIQARDCWTACEC